MTLPVARRRIRSPCRLRRASTPAPPCTGLASARRSPKPQVVHSDLIGADRRPAHPAHGTAGAPGPAKAPASSSSSDGRSLRAGRLPLSDAIGTSGERVTTSMRGYLQNGNDTSQAPCIASLDVPASLGGRLPQSRKRPLGGLGDDGIRIGANGAQHLRSALTTPLFPAAIRQLRIIRLRPIRLIGEPANISRKAASSSAQQVGERRRGQFSARQERLVRRGRIGEPDSTGRPRGNRHSRKCGCPSPPGIRPGSAHHARSSGRRCTCAHRSDGAGNRVCRAGVEAPRAAPAMRALLRRRVRLQLQLSQDHAEEQPATVLARDEVGVLALPADPRRLRQRLLHHRRGVDEDLQLARRLRSTMNRASAFSAFLTVL